MHRSRIPPELPLPPWLDSNNGLIYDSYASYQNQDERREEIAYLRRQGEREFRQRRHDAPVQAHEPVTLEESTESVTSGSSDSARSILDRFEKDRAHHRHNKRSHSHEIDTILRFEVPRKDNDDHTTSTEVSPGIGADQPWLISRSQYNGDALRIGSHSAKITKILRPSPTDHHLFRWIHMDQPIMDFGIFSRKISQISLREPEKQELDDFVSFVRQKAVRRLPSNMQGGRGAFHAKPGVIRRGDFTWLCMPYFSIEKYSDLQVAATTTAPCPIETLMQAHSSSSSKNMDLEQVICNFTQLPKDYVLHISQVWHIIVRQCK